VSEAAPGYRDEPGFVTPARRRLADVTRHLIDAVLTTEDLTDEALEGAATEIGVRTRDESKGFDYLPRSPVVGDASPFAPPFRWEVVDGRSRAVATLGAPYEGPPGFVHGGMIALVFDEVLGMANIAAGVPGMTGTLTVKYRKPTPLFREVRCEGWVERVSGRKILTRGTMHCDGVMTAEAEGIFVSIIPRLAQEYFGREPDR
jgi:acyl-coenzyme A thioesterase PaaI-like protein